MPSLSFSKIVLEPPGLFNASFLDLKQQRFLEFSMNETNWRANTCFCKVLYGKRCDGNLFENVYAFRLQ